MYYYTGLFYFYDRNIKKNLVGLLVCLSNVELIYKFIYFKIYYSGVILNINTLKFFVSRFVKYRDTLLFIYIKIYFSEPVYLNYYLIHPNNLNILDSCTGLFNLKTIYVSIYFITYISIPIYFKILFNSFY